MIHVAYRSSETDICQAAGSTSVSGVQTIQTVSNAELVNIAEAMISAYERIVSVDCCWVKRCWSGAYRQPRTCEANGVQARIDRHRICWIDGNDSICIEPSPLVVPKEEGAILLQRAGKASPVLSLSQGSLLCESAFFALRR